MTNWIDTRNPFGLPRPPNWFLEALALYDSALVLFPSMMRPVYRFGRRRRHSTGLLTLINRDSDTLIFVRERLVPQGQCLPPSLGGNWAALLKEIPEHDIWRAGGADAAADRLDGFDEAAEARLRAETEDGADARAKDSYVPAKAALGEHLSLHTFTPRSKRRYARPSFATGSAVLVGRPGAGRAAKAGAEAPR